MRGRDDIETAFRQIIVMEPTGRRTVTTADFVKVCSRLTGTGRRARITSGLRATSAHSKLSLS